VGFVLGGGGFFVWVGLVVGGGVWVGGLVGVLLGFLGVLGGWFCNGVVLVVWWVFWGGVPRRVAQDRRAQSEGKKREGWTGANRVRRRDYSCKVWKF